MDWLDKLMKDVGKTVDEAATQAASVDGGSVVIQSGRNVSIGHVGGKVGRVVTQHDGGTYVNGKRVADSGGSIDIVNGQVYVNGKRVD